MRIVLLCGGSGKRLWPLSNEIRSKVFLKLLKSKDGNKESMIERICRQLDEVGLLPSTCIVTHHSQVEITRTYVGEHIPIISEPFKRGTFAAVALSVTYLSEKMQVPSDETICILPVDTYVDSTFFQRLHRIPELISRSKTNLVLIGSKPNRPSDQFGYIVPDYTADTDDFAVVRHFVEKPNEEAAADLIKHRALWNCGVFVFPLRFMLSYLKDNGYAAQVESWLANYEQVINTSFDREVVERNPHTIVMEYEGEWHDVGNWKALTPHFDSLIGAGRISDDSVNTHLINELPYPIEIIGISNMIVAANADGILIANKDNAHRIKERLTQTSPFPMQGEKRWGSYQVLKYEKEEEHGRESMVKIVKLSHGKMTSYHLHNHRQECLTILSGCAEILMEDKLSRLVSGDVLQIPANSKHGIKAVTDLVLMEVWLGNDLTDEDIIRFSVVW
ncbi:sugar phosphate nucleotidyltransferase [Paenibacillus qinlingensis]|uniref:Mannose-1-phosphate guanylyltransferase n=1 Tax=Paenibacillus qinlingensis TaxID=1837343 RepID=A0ABU1NSI3_9BACL|nr:sugar phosphate nucleotidyltransferase [Paenibacillus qinlingensis]MDR6549977.1 mannose-1-phosphate guanylyltransferase [Paenibacillus qinlingensis]